MKMNGSKAPKKFVRVALAIMAMVIVTVGVLRLSTSYKSVGERHTANVKPGASKGTTVSYTRTPTKPYLHPPIQGANIPFKKYSVDAGKATTINYRNSKIVIPANIFCDGNGNAVTGKVDINYREFHTPVDFFLSGIPMTYDSAGQQYTFISAGMIDITGEQNSTPVMIKQGKSLQVEMQTDQNGKFNLYALDTVSKRWIFKSANNTAMVQTTVKTVKDTFDPNKPIMPRIANPKNMSFSLSADVNEYPELYAFTNTIFEVDPKKPGFDSKYKEQTWEDVDLRRVKNTDSYTITLSKGKEKHSFTVYPVVDAKDYKKSMADFNKAYADYQATLNWRTTMTTTERACAYFSVNHFGVWNSDCPSALPVGASLAATYTDDQSDNLNQTDIYVVEKDKNAMFVYHPGHNCQFNPEQVNFAWCITPKNKLAVFSTADFDKIHVTSGPYTFVMKVLNTTIASDEDAQKIFKTLL